MSKLKLISINTFFVVLIFGFFELLVWAFAPQVQRQGIDAGLFSDNLYLNSSGLKAGASGIAFDRKVNIDAEAFRLHRSKNGQTRKWLYLGDSVTMGVGVENDETFASLVNDQLTAVRIENPSVAGFNTTDYLNVIRVLVEPDAHSYEKVSLFYCLNDIYAGNPFKISGRGGIGSTINQLKEWLKSNSRLYVWLKGALLDRSEVYFAHDKQFYLQKDDDYQKAIANLVEIQNLVRSAGAKFELVLLPYEFQFRSAEKLELQEQFAQELAQNNVQCKIWRAGACMNDSESCFLYADGIHFSTNGHKLLAEQLLAWN